MVKQLTLHLDNLHHYMFACTGVCIPGGGCVAVRVPERVSFVQAAAAVGAGLKAYTALHYQARLSAGETLLVTDAAAPWCILAAQLASIWGAKVTLLQCLFVWRFWLESDGQ